MTKNNKGIDPNLQEQATNEKNGETSQTCMPNNSATIVDKEEEIYRVANEIAQLLDADVLFYGGAIRRGDELKVRDLVLSEKCRPNVLLLMCTSGGDADAAYLIAKCLQCNYDKFIFFVSGICKSAGTLVATGAHELIFSQYGELGPLDIQLRKKDDLGGQESGWAVLSALLHLTNHAYEAWETFFIKLHGGTGGQITVPTTAKIAADLATGLFAPICEQINPVYLGEVERKLTIAKEYGKILGKYGRNLKPEGLNKVIENYPSHSFVIDKHEAENIFNHVRFSTDIEEKLRKTLGSDLTFGMYSESPAFVQFLSNGLSTIQTKDDNDDNV